MLSRLPAFVVACAAVASVPLVYGQNALTSSDPLVEARETRAWLARIQEAANRRNFAGTVVVSAGGLVASTRIAHYCEGGDQFERIDSLDGQVRNVFRHNDVVHTVWPQRRVAVVEQRDQMSSFPGLLQAGSERVQEFYELKPVSVERVAGHEANVLMLKPRDKLRFGYRLWAEKTTGLLLRAEVLGERGEVLESSAFSEVSIGVRSQPDTVVQPVKRLDGFRVLKPVLVPARLDAEGWVIKASVPGFQMVSCVKRKFDSPAQSPTGGSEQQLLQTVYSDGLTYVSIFIEPYNPERHARPVATVIGATQTTMRRVGDWWVTAMGDVPPATLHQFAAGVERKK
ncbi:MAG TPA: MucB/RseB C-terminal domain-containing protein [Rhizobacter sp.]|nr:MucB/RseB C-terminal domain-containing protein [Rhizobacter sp.]